MIVHNYSTLLLLHNLPQPNGIKQMSSFPSWANEADIREAAIRDAAIREAAIRDAAIREAAIRDADISAVLDPSTNGAFPLPTGESGTHLCNEHFPLRDMIKEKFYVPYEDKMFEYVAVLYKTDPDAFYTKAHERGFSHEQIIRVMNKLKERLSGSIPISVSYDNDLSLD